MSMDFKEVSVQDSPQAEATEHQDAHNSEVDEVYEGIDPCNREVTMTHAVAAFAADAMEFDESILAKSHTASSWETEDQASPSGFVCDGPSREQIACEMERGIRSQQLDCCSATYCETGIGSPAHFYGREDIIWADWFSDSAAPRDGANDPVHPLTPGKVLIELSEINILRLQSYGFQLPPQTAELASEPVAVRAEKRATANTTHWQQWQGVAVLGFDVLLSCAWWAMVVSSLLSSTIVVVHQPTWGVSYVAALTGALASTTEMVLTVRRMQKVRCRIGSCTEPAQSASQVMQSTVRETVLRLQLEFVVLAAAGVCSLMHGLAVLKCSKYHAERPAVDSQGVSSEKHHGASSVCGTSKRHMMAPMLAFGLCLAAAAVVRLICVMVAYRRTLVTATQDMRKDVAAVECPIGEEGMSPCH